MRLEPGRVRSRIQLARAHLDTGNSPAAVRELRASLDQDPDATEAALLLALVHLQNKEFTRAREVAEQLLSSDPEHLVAVNIAGAASLGLNKLDAARMSFERAVELDVNNASGHFNLATLASREGRYEDSAQHYQAVLALNPDHAAAMIELAKLAETASRLDDAIRWREKAKLGARQEVTPNSLHLVSLYLRAGRASSALGLARTLQALERDNLHVYEALGRAELAVGDTDGAQVTFSEASRRASYDTRWLHRIARHQLAAGDPDSAYWTLIKAENGDADYLPVQSELAHLELRLDRIEEALARAQTLRERHPQSSLGDILSGDAHMASEQFEPATIAYQAAMVKSPSLEVSLRIYAARAGSGDEAAALAELEGWTAKYPGDTRTQQALGALYIRTGRFAAAQPIYEKLLKVAPSDVFALNNLALVYDATGDPRGLEVAERAFATAPDSAEVLDTLGWLLTRAGEPSRGLKYLRDAYTRAPQKVEIRHHIAAALDALGRHEEAQEERLATGSEEIGETVTTSDSPPGESPPGESQPGDGEAFETVLPSVAQAEDTGGHTKWTTPGTFWAQLGSYRKAGSARQAWHNVRSANPSLFTSLRADVVKVDLGEQMGIWYRLKVGSMVSRHDTEQFCAELKRLSPATACLPVKGDQD